MFLLKFFVVYIAGVLLYKLYLAQFSDSVDIVTRILTEQVAKILSIQLPDVTTFYCDACESSEVKYMDVTIVLLIEGCNAISVMILFVAFLVAFTGQLKNYLWFIPLGIIILYLANLFRIYLVGIIYIYANSYSGVFHDYIFPAIIYGTVLLLWIYWVKFLANGKK